ncbi:MAG: glycosyltransferase [Hyphomicrobiaceae bacterium]|nr:MAG: glycosyltransferase [Hyphomicrobiaceae bacterium]
MPLFDGLILAFCIAATSLHLITIALAIHRCRRTTGPLPAPGGAPAVSLVRPVCGCDTFEELTLRSSFELDYPDYELIFCCATASDPVVGLVRRLIAQHPQVKAKILIGNQPISANPKLNNMVKGWAAARNEWIIFADSNVLMPADYIQRLLAGWDYDTGIMCSPPIGCHASGLWAEVECAFLNTYQARWQYAADTVGFGFAQGKTMLWRRSDLVQAGGIHALGAEIAEDAASTKIVRGLGLRARLVDAPFGQPLGWRSAKQVWDRQARWSRLRRMTFPAFFLPEVLTGSIVPILAAAYSADILELPMATVVAGMALLWFGSEAVLARAAGWQLSPWSPLAWLVRDALLPVLWVQAWLLDGFSWRGSEIRAEDKKVEAT